MSQTLCFDISQVPEIIRSPFSDFWDFRGKASAVAVAGYPCFILGEKNEGEEMELTKDEIRCTRALTGAVGDVFGRLREGFAEGVLYDALSLILSGPCTDFFGFTEHPTTGATYHVTATFLPDKFREAVASTAYKLLVGRFHASPYFIRGEKNENQRQ